MSSWGPIVKTAGTVRFVSNDHQNKGYGGVRENCSFSLVIAWRAMEKSNGVIEIFVTFWKGIMKHFFVILTFSTPTPVTARYEFGSET